MEADSDWDQDEADEEDNMDEDFDVQHLRETNIYGKARRAEESDKTDQAASRTRKRPRLTTSDSTTSLASFEEKQIREEKAQMDREDFRASLRRTVDDIVRSDPRHQFLAQLQTVSGKVSGLDPWSVFDTIDLGDRFEEVLRIFDQKQRLEKVSSRKPTINTPEETEEELQANENLDILRREHEKLVQRLDDNASSILSLNRTKEATKKNLDDVDITSEASDILDYWGKNFEDFTSFRSDFKDISSLMLNNKLPDNLVAPMEALGLVADAKSAENNYKTVAAIALSNMWPYFFAFSPFWNENLVYECNTPPLIRLDLFLNVIRSDFVLSDPFDKVLFDWMKIRSNLFRTILSNVGSTTLSHPLHEIFGLFPPPQENAAKTRNPGPPRRPTTPSGTPEESPRAIPSVTSPPPTANEGNKTPATTLPASPNISSRPQVGSVEDLMPTLLVKKPGDQPNLDQSTMASTDETSYDGRNDLSLPSLVKSKITNRMITKTLGYEVAMNKELRWNPKRFPEKIADALLFSHCLCESFAGNSPITIATQFIDHMLKRWQVPSSESTRTTFLKNLATRAIVYANIFQSGTVEKDQILSPEEAWAQFHLPWIAFNECIHLSNTDEKLRRILPVLFDEVVSYQNIQIEKQLFIDFAQRVIISSGNEPTASPNAGKESIKTAANLKDTSILQGGIATLNRDLLARFRPTRDVKLLPVVPIENVPEGPFPLDEACLIFFRHFWKNCKIYKDNLEKSLDEVDETEERLRQEEERLINLQNQNELRQSILKEKIEEIQLDKEDQRKQALLNLKRTKDDALLAINKKLSQAISGLVQEAKRLSLRPSDKQVVDKAFRIIERFYPSWTREVGSAENLIRSQHPTARSLFVELAATVRDENQLMSGSRNTLSNQQAIYYERALQRQRELASDLSKLSSRDVLSGGFVQTVDAKSILPMSSSFVSFWKK